MDPCTRCEVCNNLCEIVPRMAVTFKALGDLTRLQIIYLLSTDTSGTLGVSELAARLKISQPAVSQHLKTLKTEGLVESRREGFYIYYTINRERMVEFREHFELMYSTVMANCSREMIRRSTRDRAISACVIFYSYSGITRSVAEGIRNASGCDLIEVKTREPYTAFSAYTTGVLHSRTGTCDPIEPAEIDVSGYDFLIIGTPVWAWKPSPAINAAVQALRGCEGKMAVIFTTCSTQPGEALPILSRALAARGVRVMAEISLDAQDTRNPDAGGELLRQIIAADPVRTLAGEALPRELGKNQEKKP
ncbi:MULTISPECIES: metalloregulator ArsR/SmtB family transcription factor [unclassified Methanoregula]|uniref:metalloregulator ArsR/SmtB family transcription factor n=1 Tax=unclassified Methanoregula TaxID=2649730 RepID=UPI0009CA61D8|nr:MULTISPECIES: metalloregulator ArsR/SmtB family transcription factor [unclassified Methanoregula]OPX62847.1 MAG: DNA-binding transcriptional repressor ArsR [Methanoregula sp. PtaB.Bin085]OPY35284.1 MAG: DNA-binding transcriptional repressor ArsR [Methanoregula sp. PtaU1.Bin006]